MSAAKKEEGLVVPPQEDEAREANLARSPSGENVATGVEKIELSEEREESEDRGSTVPIAGGEPVADFAEVEYDKPKGLQAEPAAFATNGSTDLTRVATPSGPQPVSAFAATPEEAQKLLERHRQNELESVQSRARGRTELSEAKLQSMSAAEIRAVAHDRGYELPDHTSHGLATRLFAERQADDPYLEGKQDAETSENTTGDEDK